MKKRSKQKGKQMDPKTPKRILGVILLAFGFLLLVSLVSFIGSEKNGLGPIFGTAVPQAFIYVFGKFSATMVSVCSICWGIWILLSRECPKYLKVCLSYFRREVWVIMI